MRLIYILIIVATTILAGCSGNDEKPREDLSEQQIYSRAKEQLKNSNYSAAVSSLQLLESRYPFGPYAEQAQLELIYAHYKAYETEAAVEAAARFIRLHPGHPNVDYAYYMKGLANFNAGKSIFDRFTDTDVTKRDPGAARQSFYDFSQLLSRFPKSEYAADARVRMIYLRNLLARYEVNVANYYFKRRAFLAAANRGRFVVENFQQTPAVADALAVMVQAYQLLDMPELAADSLTILKSNYPESPYITKEGEFKPLYNKEGAKPTLFSRLTLGLLGRDEPEVYDSRPPR
ncbi:Beta-barrel assembly machine subunit BamD [Sinobacterium caligoides]|uniref:Outer membrane protein assembly factor BamD n=1 Tax=Sinobacterium caligoides TaxID=933926 RepID=A0A3N2E0Z1_9GAMM|nr:outer membrane protein assembly factor BamD [Sinobacterium caligoides]ROS05793.1 Beta-barrel assembly machine subunit BamD [Sinobacterium caligoides]